MTPIEPQVLGELSEEKRKAKESEAKVIYSLRQSVAVVRAPGPQINDPNCPARLLTYVLGSFDNFRGSLAG